MGWFAEVLRRNPELALVFALRGGYLIRRIRRGSQPLGAGKSAPGLAAVQKAAQSSVPTLGYSVTYAPGNILLALGGSVIVSLLPR